ncbi:MAG: hypothetical protein LBI42_13830 [Chitinispirillales bacterium]|nr:hypothetical protein [Chitinispirillales bacterium]
MLKKGGSSNNIRELINILERNSYNQEDWYVDEDELKHSADEDDEDAEPDLEDIQLVIFASEGPFTESFIPMLKQFDVVFYVTDEPEVVIDIFMQNSQIRHVLIDMDRPTDPNKGMNVFSDLKTINSNLLIHYCTKNPLSMESRNIQSKGAHLMQKPILRKTVEQYVTQNFMK